MFDSFVFSGELGVLACVCGYWAAVSGFGVDGKAVFAVLLFDGVLNCRRMKKRRNPKAAPFLFKQIY